VSNNHYLDRLKALDKVGAHADTALKDYPASPGKGFEGFEGAEGSPFLNIEGQRELDVGSLHAVAPVDSFEGFEGTQGRAVSKIEGRPPGSEIEKGPSLAALKTLKTSTAHNLDELSQDRENEVRPTGDPFETFETPIEAGPGDHTFDLDACSSLFAETVQNVQNVQNTVPAHAGSAEAGGGRFAHPRPSSFERAKWAGAAEHILAELGRHQRGDFSRRKWQRMLAGVRGFVESGWAHLAWRLDWHMLELFGVDRKAPCARDDRRGLALMLDDSKVIAVTEHGAIIETASGARQAYTRRTTGFLDAVLIDQIAPAYRLTTIRREWAEVLQRVDRCRPTLAADVSETRWRQYLADLRRLADENWDYPPIFFMGWDGRGAFPVSAKRALAWLIDGGTITNLTHEAAVCGKVVFRRLPGDQGWQLDVSPHLDHDRKRAKNWLSD
jgi:hypothetical protein